MTERGGMDRRTFLKVMGFSFGTATVGATLPTPASGAPAVEAAKGSELVAAPESKEYVNYRKTLKSLSNSASREILLDSLNSESEQSQDSTREFNQLAENILGAWAEELAGKDADENVVEGFKRRYKESGVINLWREMCMGLSDTEKIDRKAITKCLVENVRMSYIAMEVARDNYEKWQFPQSNDLSGALDTPGAVDFRRIVKKKRPATDPTMEAGEQIETFLDLGDDRDLDTQGQVFVAPRSIIADVALGERSLSSDQRKILLETLKPLDGYAYGIGRML